MFRKRWSFYAPALSAMVPFQPSAILKHANRVETSLRKDVWGRGTVWLHVAWLGCCTGKKSSYSLPATLHLIQERSWTGPSFLNLTFILKA